ncbi:hypothetical protein [Paenibacillus alvei]|uniref:hypothetical protein n=1 Tax=Paenibacillus TaxID=44249 RepID=UPI002280B497|nr:hypothetical protein [Paenibacillus alvei]
MSTLTNKLKLIKPEHTDETYQTILDLASNFQKIDDESEIYATSYPISGHHPVAGRVWNLKPDTGDYAGWICTRAGIAAPKWTGITSFSIGNRIVPSVDNGHVYECTQAGYSAVLEPTFPVASGSEVQDTKGAAVWKPSTIYKHHDVVFPTIDNGRFYVCVVAGESGIFEPTWAASNGITTNDGNAVWSSYRIAKWKEAGVASMFRPFGKID